MQPSATKVVVADAGPLIALGRLDRLALLGGVFEQVQVPRAVLAECLARPELEDAQRIMAAVADGTLLPCEATAIDASGLQTGERAVLGFGCQFGLGLFAPASQSAFNPAFVAAAASGPSWVASGTVSRMASSRYEAS